MIACPTVAIVGGGASGTLTAAHLAAAARGRPLQILLVEPGEIGQGIAYSTTDPRHRLNVRAEKMSAWPTRPQHFLDWLHAHVDTEADAYHFAARMEYGRYLRYVLTESLGESPTVTFEHIRTRAGGATLSSGRLRLELTGLPSRLVDVAVLALGNGRPSSAWAPVELVRSERFIADPWAPGALDRVPADQPLMLVGAGLTMADMVVALDSPGRTVHAVSRHGMLPLAHTSAPLAEVPPPDLPAGTLTARRARKIVGEHVRQTVAHGADWRCAVDSLRPVTAELWSRLDDASRALVLGGLGRHWDRLRHRVAPSTGNVLADRLADGSLVSHTGSVVAATETAESIEVTVSGGRRISVGAVLNCTGPHADLQAADDPLLRAMFDTGAASAGPMNIGLDTAANGRIVPAYAGAELELWTLGPLRRGSLWETTAIPEIRDQAAALAAALLATAYPTTLPSEPLVDRVRVAAEAVADRP